MEIIVAALLGMALGASLMAMANTSGKNKGR